MAPITSAIRRQMTDECARVTADRDEFLAVCDAVDAIHARKLKALDASTRRVDELCRENERLRGLVRIAGTYCVNGLCGKDDGCPLYLGKPYCALPDRMRELGIEVSE